MVGYICKIAINTKVKVLIAISNKLFYLDFYKKEYKNNLN